MSGSTSIYMRFSHTIKSGNSNNQGLELDTGDTTAMLLHDFNGNGLSDLVVGDDPPDIVRESYLLNFTNKEIDYTLDLHYFGARYYHSTFPRFISPDPVGGNPMLPITWNRYLYCRNDPVNYLDPDGRDAINNTTYVLWVKDADSPKVFPLLPGGRHVGEQDGICDSKNHPGTVFKTSGGLISDGVHVEIRGDGSISWFSLDPSAVVGQLLRGGEKDNAWNKTLKLQDDEGWDPLFQKANDPTSADIGELKKQIADAIDFGNLPIENAYERLVDAAK